MVTMNTRSADTGADKAPAQFPKSEGVHKEALLDEALAETFPASDPISPAYEARLEAQRAAVEDQERVRRIGASVTTGLFGVGAVAALLWLARSLTRRQMRL